MVRSFVEAILGGVGRQILYFYEAHALTINLIVLTYGLIMLMSWITLVRIYRHMVVTVATRIHKHPKLNRKSTIKKIRDSVEIPWQEAVDIAPFPLIARMAGLIPKRKSVENVQQLLDEEELNSHALDVLKGTHPRKIMPSYRRMMQQEIEAISDNTED